MTFPDPDHLLYDGEYSTSVLEGIIAQAGNLCFGDNPPYTFDDFIAFYPQFGPTGDPPVMPIPQAVLQIYINLASASLQYARWLDSWQVGMALFIAHYATLYLQSLVPAGSDKAAIVQAGLARGVQVSKAVGPVNVSYQLITANLEDWGAWNLTVFGQQLASMAKLIGMGGMYVW
jgi:hypothetical protein